MEIFKVKFINRTNQQFTELIVVHYDNGPAIDLAKDYMNKLGFPFNDGNQDIICTKIERGTPGVVSLLMP